MRRGVGRGVSWDGMDDVDCAHSPAPLVIHSDAPAFDKSLPVLQSSNDVEARVKFFARRCASEPGEWGRGRSPSCVRLILGCVFRSMGAAAIFVT